MNPNDTTTPTATDVLETMLTQAATNARDLAFKDADIPEMTRRMAKSYAHQLHQAELLRIGSDEETVSVITKQSSLGKSVSEVRNNRDALSRNQFKAELREAARQFYGQNKEEA